jgi:hypothetical protein
MALEGSKTWLRRTVEKKEADATATSATSEAAEIEAGPTIPEILHDPSESKSFGQMLASKNDPDLIKLGARLRSGTPDEADMKLAQKYRTEYLEQKERAEELNGTLDTRFDEILRSSPDLAAACEAFGKDNYLSVLKRGLAELVMKDPKAFAKIEKRYTLLADAERNINDPEAPLNKKISDFCKKYSLTEDRMNALLQEPDAAKRTKNIQDVYRDEMSFFGRWMDKRDQKHGRVSSLDHATYMADATDEIEAILADRMKLLERSGNVLTGLISKNPDLRNALISAKPGEEPKLKEGIDSTMSFAETQAKTIKLKEFDSGWRKYLNDKRINDFSTLDTVSQDVEREQFMDEYTKQQVANNKGFWAGVLEYMLSTKLRADPSLKARLN